jgi:nitroreductase
VIKMEAIEAIMGRRSIRRYTDKKINEDIIKILLKAAMNAPSAHNKQPWHFIVVDDIEIMKKITKYHPYSKMLENASHAIVVLGDNDIQTTDFWIHDCSAATENILIAANSLGVGAVWVGVHPSEALIEETKKLFSVPDHVIPLCIISLGFPMEAKPPRENFNPERVHSNIW